MKRFITQIILYTVGIFLLFFSIEWLMGKSLDEGKRYYFQADWHDLKNHNADVLVIGNSRTWVHYDPFLIEKKTGLKTEAIAQDGQGAQVVWLKFKTYFKNNSAPHKILLQFDHWFMHQRADLYGIKNFRTGFWNDRIGLRELKRLNGYSAYFHYLPLAAIDFDLFWRWAFNHQIPEAESYARTHGFMPQQKSWKGNWKNPDVVIDTGMVSQYMDSFFVYAKKNQVDMYLIYPPQSYPSYQFFTGKEKIKKQAEMFNQKYQMNVPFIDYNSAAIYNDSTLFYNHMHLNQKGVAVFMRQMLADSSIFD
jgi:hypothetical protein